MLSYYLNNTNSYTIRTENTSSNQFVLSLQDMLTQTNSTAVLGGVSFTPYENLLAFTASINGAYTGQEFRVTVLNGENTEPIWYGSLQVYQSQSVDKAVYKTQNDQYISNESTNEYIIMN